jgi:hypothetical protein
MAVIGNQRRMGPTVKEGLKKPLEYLKKAFTRPSEGLFGLTVASNLCNSTNKKLTYCKNQV